MNVVDRFLNSVTMYRLVNQGLLLLAGISVLFAYTGLLSYSGNGMLLSFFIATFTCYVSNVIFGKWWKVPVNAESSSITAVILFFLFTPVMTLEDVYVLVAACLIAMLSKYVIAWQGKHAFNPAAFGAAAMSAVGFGGAVWWVATPWLLPFTTILGLLIARKIRRLSMFLVIFGCCGGRYSVGLARGLGKGILMACLLG
jgi:Na+-transporting NADH:ubiquinone oxidoreductase subunit NqrB